MPHKMSQKMADTIKVCVLGTRGFPNVQGGVETHCENLFPRLVQLGCEVTVYTRPDYVDEKIKEYQGVKLVPIKSPKNKFLEAFVHTARGIIAARRAGCDVVHIHAIGPAFFVPFARLLGLKVIMTHHGPDYDRQKWGRAAKTFLRTGERFGSLGSNEVISISQTISNNLIRNYNKVPALIPNGVFVPETVTTQDALLKFGLQKQKYVLAVGRFVPEKGFHDLIKAFSRLTTDWKLVIVGGADHEDHYSRDLKQQAAQNKNIVMTGYQKGVPLKELFAHAGLFVLPSYHEGLPIVLLEAMSYGLSCVLSDIPANVEVDLPQERYFKAGDIVGMAKKLQEFIGRGALSDAQREDQLAVIRQRYNWDEIAQKTLNVYRFVASGKKNVY
jgi:glycosyltransferase involved in cell wall biosynthesis